MLEIKYENEIKVSDRKKVFWWFMIRNPYLMIPLLSMISVIVICTIAYDSGMSFMWKCICDVAFLLCLIGVLVLLSMPKAYAERNYKKTSYNKLSLSIEGVELITDAYCGLLEWGKFKEITETKGFVFLLRTGDSPFVLYKNYMAPELLKEVLSLLKDVLVTKKKVRHTIAD